VREEKREDGLEEEKEETDQSQEDLDKEMTINPEEF